LPTIMRQSVRENKVVGGQTRKTGVDILSAKSEEELRERNANSATTLFTLW